MPLLKKLRLKSFRQTVVALVWLSVSVPVAILFAYQLRDSYEQSASANERDLEQQTERASFEIGQTFRQLMDDLDRIASDGAVIRSLSMPMFDAISKQKLDEILAGNSALVNVMLIDQDANALDIVPSAELATDLKPYHAFLEQLIASPDAIHDPRPRLFIVKQNNGQEQLAFARPIIVASHSLTQPFMVRGLLVVSLSSEKLTEKLRTSGKYHYDFLRLSSKDNTVFEDRKASPAEYSEKTALIPFGRTDQALSITLKRSPKDLLSGVWSALRRQVLVALLFMGLMLLVVKKLADKLGHPLEVLSQLTSNMSNNSFKESAPVQVPTHAVYYTEFEQAFHLLHDMDVTIRDQFAQLHEANAHLEEKVSERTTELEKNLQLINKQRSALNALVQYSIDIQASATMEEAGRMSIVLAESISNQRVGIVILRSECFSGYRHYDGLEPEWRQLLADKAGALTEFSGLSQLAADTSGLQFFAIGGSELAYQGFLVTAKNERSQQANEALMVLCTILSSTAKQLNLNGKLNRLAHVDSVTNLPNRHYFSATFKEKTANFLNGDVNFGVFVIDVNGLKTVNDRYGHESGDQMLKIVATAIRAAARSNDTVARVGGDEFYILFENENSDGCTIFAKRLAAATKNMSMTINNIVIPLSFSFGFACTDLDPVDQLIALADDRMYDAKKQHYAKLGILQRKT